jgi:predicted DNA-binding transcriptional regulator YafY
MGGVVVKAERLSRLQSTQQLMNRVERLTAILLYLQERPRTSEEIAQHFEVSKRTIIRDVQALSEMGVPVIAREGAGGGYSLPKDYTLSPLALSSREAFLLLLALDALNKLGDAPFARERASLLAKLRAVLPGRSHDDAERWLTSANIEIPRRSERAPFLEALLDAAARGIWVRVEYQSADQRTVQHLFPRRVFAEHGLWYCDAFSCEREEDRRYRVDRVQALRVLEALDEDLGQPPASMDYDDAAHPLIEATFTPRGLALIEHLPTVIAHVRRNDDGSGSYAQRVPPSELAWYARTFASLGDEVKVHEPVELSERMAQLGHGLVERYAKR